ncbi:MAG: PQQ-binding-like beta-propeller repeat protein [Planctomycetaceae bacterium]|nr:PQQ-like beta-propeller repeat protein [Planctomycetaceae bacterium]MDG2390047.1 PQQ-binding-like beta-propeller repeat protein [Planctomycetaceae bacterium]
MLLFLDFPVIHHTWSRWFLLVVFVSLSSSARAEDWSQGPGPTSNFQTNASAPTSWSRVRDQNIAWTITLPETGQSTPIVCGEKLFFSTMKPVSSDAELGKDIIAWCCNKRTGEILWQREIAGQHPLRLSGCFSDSSAPPAVCDGERVVFVNASGTVACFDLEGKPVWSREILSAGRTLPCLHNGNIIFTRQIYPPDPDGNFPHKYADSPVEMWTQLNALDMKTGETVWVSKCGVNMGCLPLLQKLDDGRSVLVVGRGGGHGPPEKPEGISMVNAEDGATLWTLPLDGFMSTMTYSLHNNQVHLFHKDEHLSVDALTGEIVSRVSILNEVPVCRLLDTQRITQTETIPDKKKGRMMTQSSNLLVGPYHYFRSYTHPYLGRANVETGSVEYLELPLQLVRGVDPTDLFLWYDPSATSPNGKKAPKPVPINLQSIAANDMQNSRGLVVMGDKRSQGNGWGHIAAPSPSVAGDHLYVPVMNGTVYVLKWNAKTFDEAAIVSINDLGPAGQSWTRASFSFSEGRIFAHTIRELICIGE